MVWMGSDLEGEQNMVHLYIQIITADICTFRTSQLRCDVECDGLLISVSFKLLCLAIGSWAVFYRRPKSTLPRLILNITIAMVSPVF